MSRWRGFVATLSALTLIHLVFLSSRGACLLPSGTGAHAVSGSSARSSGAEAGGEEGEGDGHATSRPMGHHVHATPAHSDAAPQGAETDTGERHDATRSCTSLASCSIAAAPAAASERAVGAAPVSDRVDWVPRALSSFAAAPELPPPRG